jgi:hypothetical protein
MFANVPRTITRSLPRREPYELNSGRDVIGGHGVPEHDEDPRVPDVLRRVHVEREPGEERRLLDVRGVLAEREEVTFGDAHAVPHGVAVEDVRVRAREHLLVDLGLEVRHLLLAGPDLGEVDVFALAVLPERLLRDVDRGRAGERVGHHEGR